MNQKVFDRKAAQQFTVDSRNNSKTDQEIYNELSLQYSNKKAIALLITGTVTPENKIKYQSYNNILLGLLGISFVNKLLYIFMYSMQTGQTWALLLIFIFPLINIAFFFGIKRFEPSMYRSLGIIAIVGLLNSFKSSTNIIEVLINLALCCSIAGLAFYLDKNMLPNFSPQKLKKDMNGEYILV